MSDRRQEQIPVQPVENPILCSPYQEPERHWLYRDGVPTLQGGRREASYWYKTSRTGSIQEQLFREEERDDLPLVNALRQDVRRWRESGFRGASKVTVELLQQWARPDAPRRLFFCQCEAVETLIYLLELRVPRRSSRTGFQKFALSDRDLEALLKGDDAHDLPRSGISPSLLDKPAESGLEPLIRLGCKMATGSGKTLVMAMLIAWAFCNRRFNPATRDFPNGVLICCPNLTVKKRLQVLRPELPGNYYDFFDLVPGKYRDALNGGKVLVTNWHILAPKSESREGDQSYRVVQKGEESGEAFARDRLGELFERLPILVFNDEGHHCWRPAPAEEREPASGALTGEALTGEERQELKEEEEEARVWLEGLDKINNCGVLGPGKRSILACVDLSATPFYIKGSGRPEGRPFPWLVSDFGLVDAIESGIVKIPRLPVRDDATRKDDVGRPDPKYFRLWRNVNESIGKGERLQNGRPKPEAVYREAQGALLTIASQWKERFEYIQAARPEQQAIPPVLIVVCDNTEIAEVFFRKISGEREEEVLRPEDLEGDAGGGDGDSDEVGGSAAGAGAGDTAGVGSAPKKSPRAKAKGLKKRIVYGRGEVFPEHFSNTPTERRTVRIDTRLLKESEIDESGGSRKEQADALRQIIDTVGKPGQPGEHVRCVVSVSMLTEGWDASNVTHVLGVRAFDSQLLCEQVVGRGLRRMSYDPDPETGLLLAEYVDVYGIPFSIIPFKGRKTDQKDPDDKPRNRVFAVPSRRHFEIRIPVVEAYVYALRQDGIQCDVGSLEEMIVHPAAEPTHVWIDDVKGYVEDAATPPGHGYVRQGREEYYTSTTLQTILFRVAQRIVDDLLAGATAAAHTDIDRAKLRLQARHLLFPQVFRIVRDYVDRKVVCKAGVDKRELGLQRYSQVLVERIRDGILPVVAPKEAPLLPVLNAYRPFVSTAGVDYITTRPVRPVERSHLNCVAAQSGWETAAAETMDRSDLIECYARNERQVGLVIPYDYMGQTHQYVPDFVVRLNPEVSTGGVVGRGIAAEDTDERVVPGVHVILEIKGFEHFDPDRVNAKNAAAKKWISAVNNLGDFGWWRFCICRDVSRLESTLLCDEVAT